MHGQGTVEVGARLGLSSAFALVFVIVGAAASQAADSSWSVEDLLLAEQAAGFAVSPDGDAAVWVKSQMDKAKGKKVSNLVLKRLSG